MKIPVTTLPLCKRCLNRRKCDNKGPKVTKCEKDMHNTKALFYKPDAAVLRQLKRTNADEVEAFLAGLERTKRGQIEVTQDFGIIYKPKSNDVRRFNSRSSTTIRVRSDGLDYKRYCENCGAHFHTVNATRRLCDACHDEICEKLGVDYSLVPDWDKRNRKGGEE